MKERLWTPPLYDWPGQRTRYVRVRLIWVTGRCIRIPDELLFIWWS
jgi:hypothetical protein